MVEHTCNPGTQEVETGALSQARDQPGIQNEYKISLGYIAKLCPKQSNTPIDRHSSGDVTPILQVKTLSSGHVKGRPMTSVQGLEPEPLVCARLSSHPGTAHFGRSCEGFKTGKPLSLTQGGPKSVQKPKELNIHSVVCTA